MYESMGWQAASNTLLMPLFVIAILLSFAFVTRKKSNE
jgi:hypothetical protein